MSGIPKALKDAYDEVCQCVEKKNFYEWIVNSKTYISGQLCYAPILYEDEKKWILIDAQYDPLHEEDATWRAIEYTGGSFPTLTGPVKKHFELGKGETLITVKGKIRPVILLKKYICNWNDPEEGAIHYWLCLPLFTFKEKHHKDYVRNIQRFKISHIIYIPPAYDINPGVQEESGGRFQSLQIINEKYLSASKCMSSKYQARLCYKVTNLGLRMILFHFFKDLKNYLGEFYLIKDDVKDLENTKRLYDFFVEYVNELLDNAV
ncbi:MAG: hypothetical protein ACTSRI_18980 [Promethearchaeota archaeon]